MEPPEEFFDELKYIASNPIKGMHRYMPGKVVTISGTTEERINQIKATIA